MRFEEVEELLKLNRIDIEIFEKKLYQTLILGVFEAICKDIIKQNTKLTERDLYRKRQDKVAVTKSIVNRYVGCTLSEDGYVQISKLLAAFFSTGDPRRSFEKAFRDEITEAQKYKCAICGKPIGDDAHLDHIIPWNYVGDCLPNNYQMLCETCNTRKGNSTYFELSMLLLSKGTQKES